MFGPNEPTPPLNVMLGELISAGVVKINNNSTTDLLIVPCEDLYRDGLYSTETINLDTVDILWKLYKVDDKLGPLFWCLITNFSTGPSPRMKDMFEKTGWKADGDWNYVWEKDRALSHFRLPAQKTTPAG